MLIVCLQRKLWVWADGVLAKEAVAVRIDGVVADEATAVRAVAVQVDGMVGRQG